MKMAGDYEMMLSDQELAVLIGDLAKDGVIDFDDNKVKQAVSEEKRSARAKGELYAVSDAVETVIVIQLDEYQKNSSSPKIKKLKKDFRWKNIEQDATHYKNNIAILKANDSVTKIKGLMNDQRLLKKGQR
jgi:predicted RND superfamily exporter protein